MPPLHASFTCLLLLFRELSAAGRFLRTDPVGIGESSNLYSYVSNRPTTAIDPAGLMTITPMLVLNVPCGGFALDVRYHYEPIDPKTGKPGPKEYLTKWNGRFAGLLVVTKVCLTVNISECDVQPGNGGLQSEMQLRLEQ
jgi:hypothetical protein